MNRFFEALSEDEYARLKEAIPLITILIAGADGNIDQKETSWAKKITKVRTYSTNEVFHEYYEEIGLDFSEKLEGLIISLPEDVQARQTQISEKLENINPILEKLDPRIAANLYDDFRSFAKHVARASGGFLKFFAMTAAEARWAKLPMLRRIDTERTLDDAGEEE